MKMRIAVVSGFWLLLVGAVVPPASAFDATGTWVGKWSCKTFDGAKGTTSNSESTLLISQTGTVMAVDLDAAVYRYNGVAISDAAKPEKGEAAFLSCAIDNQPASGALSELVRVAVKTKIGTAKATLKGVSLYQATSGGFGTCKYSFKRTSDANPNIASCPS